MTQHKTMSDELVHGQTYLNKRGDLIGPMDERAPGRFLDQYGRGYEASGQMWDHTPKSTANIDLGTAGATEGWAP